jgi:hypothetical protein
MDALGDDFTDADLNSAGERITRAVRAICALPARNADDVSLKLTAMSDGNQVRNDCDLNAAIDELCNVLSDGIRAGHAHEKGIDA